jgi:hypothetical protein
VAASSAQLPRRRDGGFGSSDVPVETGRQSRFPASSRVGGGMSALWLALGIIVVVLTAANVLFTMVLPRRPRGIERTTLVINRVVRLAFIGISRLARTYETKDLLLSPMAPVALVIQLLFWATSFVIGFALILLSTAHNFGDALLQSLTAIFTVGAVHIGGKENTAVDISIGAIWVVVVALQIAYLPALYSAFSQREALVSMLESRAGVPAWGPELLARHQLVGISDTLPELYSDWELWAAAVAESHTTYPVLLLFRSPEPWYSWVIGLLAVLDGAAMHLALAPSSASSQARLCLRMGFTTFNRVATTLGIPVDLDPDPDGSLRVTFEEFVDAVDMLKQAGFAMERSPEEAWPDFKGWRVNYENVAYELADHLMAPPAPWSGNRHYLHSGPIAPRRPPQRRPRSSIQEHRPGMNSPPSRARGSWARPTRRSRRPSESEDIEQRGATDPEGRP